MNDSARIIHVLPNNTLCAEEKDKRNLRPLFARRERLNMEVVDVVWRVIPVRHQGELMPGADFEEETGPVMEEKRPWWKRMVHRTPDEAQDDDTLGEREGEELSSAYRRCTRIRKP